MTEKRLQKLFKAGTVDLKENQFSCVASTTGNIDRTGDVIMPGAFKSAILRDCEQNGWVAVGHGWDDLPVAMPESLKVVNDELIATATFHSTERGQEARTVVKERLEASKSVSVSIGFMPDYGSTVSFDSGEEMIKWIEEAGHDMTQFDVPGIKAYKKWCRLITTIKELFEWSIVTVGANPRAKTLEAKTFSGGEGRDLPFAEHLKCALGAAEEITDRLEEIKTLRESEGKTISKTHEPTLRELRDRLNVILDAFQPDMTEQDSAPQFDTRVSRLRLAVAQSKAA